MSLTLYFTFHVNLVVAIMDVTSMMLMSTCLFDWMRQSMDHWTLYVAYKGHQLRLNESQIISLVFKTSSYMIQKLCQGKVEFFKVMLLSNLNAFRSYHSTIVCSLYSIHFFDRSRLNFYVKTLINGVQLENHNYETNKYNAQHQSEIRRK